LEEINRAFRFFDQIDNRRRKCRRHMHPRARRTAE
jgi:hypothetical protein